MVVMDKTAPRFDGYYVRAEFAANHREVLIGVTQGGKPAILRRYAVWAVPIGLVQSARGLATTVDTFAREQHVHNLCDMSNGLMMRYKLQPGDEIYGEGFAPARSRTGSAKQVRRDKVRASEKDGRSPAGV